MVRKDWKVRWGLLDKLRQSFKSRLNGPFITELLVGINVLVFIWLTLVGGSTNIMVLVTHGAMVPELVKNGNALLTIFTSMFVHIGIEHILFNMITLYFIGRLLEGIIGHWKFLTIYVLSGIFANVVTLAFSSPNTVSAGASGAIFGIIGVWLMMAEQYRDYPFLAGMGRQMLIFSVLGILGGFIGTNINIIAHVGGLVAGFLLAYIISFPNLGKVPTWKRSSGAVLLLFMMATFLKLAFTL
ncbi:membrane-associated serine protease [Pediococcus stilesii]|uniref:Membrane-associated serine protease n=1 Tax=Pediococcus stilesii TaxID=331679 RepID=A0A0R2KSW4_9LACO|nr:membrane-associated serine protease [Pediococcus stilesii]